jgi:pre-rRNA-processing protein TSR4
MSALSLEPPTSTSLAPPHPAYLPAQYLSTIDEYLAPPDDVDMDDGDASDADEPAEQKAEWRDERFEQMLTKGIDPLFERFVRRLGDAEGARGQVLRSVETFVESERS